MLVRLSRSILGCRKGNGLIELAVVMPVLTLMVLGLTDVTRAYVMKLHLEQVARTGGEYANASTERVPTTTEIQAQLANDSGLPASDITVKRWLECDGVNVGDVDYCSTSSEVPAQYISVDVSDTYKPVFNMVHWGSGATAMRVTGHQTVRVR